MSSPADNNKGPLSLEAKRTGPDLQALLAALGPEGLQQLNAAAAAAGITPPGENATSAAGSTVAAAPSASEPPGENANSAAGSTVASEPPGESSTAAAGPPGESTISAAGPTVESSASEPHGEMEEQHFSRRPPPVTTRRSPRRQSRPRTPSPRSPSNRRPRPRTPSPRSPSNRRPRTPSPRSPSNRRPRSPHQPLFGVPTQYFGPPAFGPSSSASGYQSSGRRQNNGPEQPRNRLHDPSAYPAAASSSSHRGPVTSTPRGGFNSSSGFNASGGFNTSRVGKDYPRTYLNFCKAGPNAVQSVPGNDAYRSYGTPGNLVGTQSIGSPTPSARIRKLEMRPGLMYTMDTDGNKQRLYYDTFGEALPRIKAADMLSITSFTPGHYVLANMHGWEQFLEPCLEFTLDGLLTETLLKVLLPRLPNTLKAMIILPHETSLQMSVTDVTHNIPASVRYFTFDTTCFPHCSLVTLIIGMHRYEGNRFARLVLFGRSFPDGLSLHSYNNFFQDLDNLTRPLASVSVFTTCSPGDVLLQPLLNRGFLPGYRHRRTHGKFYDTYTHAAHRRYLVGFLVPKAEDPGEQEEEDEEDNIWFY